jgi:hypothetical protein
MIWPMPERPAPYAPDYKTNRILVVMRRKLSGRRVRVRASREFLQYTAPPNWTLAGRVQLRPRGDVPSPGPYRRRFSF